MVDPFDDDDDNGLVDEIGSANKAPEAPAARPVEQQKPPKKRKSAGYYTLAIALSVLTCLLFYETVFLIGIGMLPSGVAHLIDTHPRRYAAKTVAWTNLAGALVIALELWGGDRSLETAFALLQDPLNWIIMLGAAAIGWIIHFVVPGMVRRYLDISLAMRKRSVQDKMNKLILEWGTDVKQAAPSEELAALEALGEGQGDANGNGEGENNKEEPDENARP